MRCRPFDLMMLRCHWVDIEHLYYPLMFSLVSHFFLVSIYLSRLATSDLQALYLSGTYCHKTSTRPPSCNTPRELTVYLTEPFITITLLPGLMPHEHQCYG